MPKAANRAPRRSPGRKGLFELADGSKVTFTFFLVASLFLLWGFCNGMIDVMDKHFQDKLNLTKAQSAWIQFAHYMGYTIMALPAGLLARRLGYKGGIISGLLLVSIGGFWFMPATQIAQFWAFLLGVCLIAMGLTVLETVANPYTTVLGPKEYGPTRINLAQSFNGIGWILGPAVGAEFFYAAGGVDISHEQLYIPYVGVALVVLVLAALFFFANVPDIRVEDEYHTDEAAPGAAADTARSPRLSFVFMLLNAAVLAFAAYMILNLVLPPSGFSEETVGRVVPLLVVAGLAVAGWMIYSGSRNLSAHSIWAHPHFSGATVAQFLYVAAQAGIFSFFINYIVEEMPAISAGLASMWPLSGNATLRDGMVFVNEKGASRLQGYVAFALFCAGRFIGSAILRKAQANRVLGVYALINIALCGVVAMKLGWISVAAVFLSFYFMSIMFPTIFALGIYGLGPQSKKKASAFIVMSITGGALMPKIMGHLGDTYNMSVGFLMPMACFAGIALYGFFWPALSRASRVTGLKGSGGH